MHSLCFLYKVELKYSVYSLWPSRYYILCDDRITWPSPSFFFSQLLRFGEGWRSTPVMAHQQMPSSQKALMLELKSLQEEPVEGFRITLVAESDLYNWEVAIFGPPNTLYEGGYFKVQYISEMKIGIFSSGQLTCLSNRHLKGHTVCS